MTALWTCRVEIAFGGATTSNYLHLNDSARGILDTNTLGPDDGVWTDVTAYVHRFRVNRGATRIESPLVRYEAGTVTIELNNNDRRFDPTNLTGPYVSGGATEVVPMRAVRILVAYAGVTYEVYRGFADEWAISYDGPHRSLCVLTCTDATKVLANYTRIAVGAVGASEDTGARITRILNGISWSTTDRIIATGDTTVQATTLGGNVWEEMLLTADTEIGELFVDEGGRIYYRNRQGVMEDPRSTSAMGKFGDSLNVGISTTVNYATNPSAETDLTNWSGGGFANPPTVTRDSTHAQFGTWAVLGTWATASGGDLPQIQYTVSGLTVGRTYTMSMYAYVPTGSPLVALFVPVANVWGTNTGTTKDAFVRIQLTLVAWATTALLQVWPDQSTTTAGQKVWLDGLQIEEGSSPTTYCDGTQTYCEWDGTAHASTSRRLPEMAYHDVEIAYDDSTVANIANITRVGGSVQTAQDATSQATYLARTFERSDLIMETDSVASDYASFIIYQAKDAELRFSTLTITPERDPANLFPQVFGRRIGDRIRIVRRPPGGGSAVTREVFIRGIEHNATPATWVTRWALQSATRYAFLTLDHATLGVLDANALAF